MLPPPTTLPVMLPTLPTLPTLPHDLLRLLTTHLPTASSLAALSLTCRSLHAFISLEGWRVFVRTRFPAFPATAGTPAEWRAWARQQTTVERNWQRRGFMAAVVEVRLSSGSGGSGGGGGGGGGRRGGRGGGGGGANGREGKWAPKGRQTLGYVPVLDLSEAYGGAGGDEEALVIGAGPDIVVRRRSGAGKRTVRWWGFEDRNEQAGRDDVTALRLLEGGGGETAVVGRANGRLEIVGLGTAGRGREPGGVGRAEVLARYETDGRQVKDVAVLGGNGGGGAATTGLVCAVLGSFGVSLYPLHPPEEGEAASGGGPVEAVSSIVLADVGGGIPWKTSFLSPALMALGTTGTQPLSVFALAREGFRRDPVRTFSASQCADVEALGVYALAPISGSGNVLLAGWYDGVSRLHDLRTPAPSVAEYKDPIDAQTPIYALHPLGHTRFLAGGARHCILKIFDLRMATAHGGSGGWATYLAPPARYRAHGGMGGGAAAWESPLYSLAVAAGGRSVYAGAQGRVWELDFLGAGVGAGAGGGGQRRDVGTRLGMYEFGGKGVVYHQGPETEMGRAGVEGGRLDGRWRAV